MATLNTLFHEHKKRSLIVSPVETSIFDLLKCGPGPSSSHTIGPMKAGYDFLCLCREKLPEFTQKPDHFLVRLYGSLSATGKGHGTCSAVLAGLLGHSPEKCPAGLLKNLGNNPDEHYTQLLGDIPITLSLRNIIYDTVVHDFPYNNTLVISLMDMKGEALFEREYYSVGGGFIQWKGWKAPEFGKPVHPYQSMKDLQNRLEETGLTLHELLLDNETAITGKSRVEILQYLDDLIETMIMGVKRGLSKEGVLPGTLNVHRKAGVLYERAKTLNIFHERFLTNLNAYAMATAEENADGGVIVTTPTCGASGVLPALLYAMRYDMHIGDRAVREGFLAAVAIGFLAKHNAAIAGAEVGCQGEIGVASAMSAAMLTHARGFSAEYTANAAEVALEHHLGLTCDPVGGYVQIPCIERNAVGAVKAYNAFLLAISEDPKSHRVSLDSAIEAMGETGREMNAKFKETSLGGLAVSMVNC
ncbi:MAG TPA: L-serine ammonia-lyase [Desulfovibrio sp.]|nr:L-serine ammonia-lyase [Desulfovibrio sp.]